MVAVTKITNGSASVLGLLREVGSAMVIPLKAFATACWGDCCGMVVFMSASIPVDAEILMVGPKSDMIGAKM